MTKAKPNSCGTAVHRPTHQAARRRARASPGMPRPAGSPTGRHLPADLPTALPTFPTDRCAERPSGRPTNREASTQPCLTTRRLDEAFANQASGEDRRNPAAPTG